MLGYIKSCDVCGHKVNNHAMICPNCFGDPNLQEKIYEQEALARGHKIAEESHARLEKVLQELKESEERSIKKAKESKKKAKIITDEDNEISSLLKLGYEYSALEAVRKLYDCKYSEAKEYIVRIKDDIKTGNYDNFSVFFYFHTFGSHNHNGEIITIYGDILTGTPKESYLTSLRKEEELKNKVTYALSLEEVDDEGRKFIDAFFQNKPNIMKEREVRFKEALTRLKSNSDKAVAEMNRQKNKWFGKKDYADMGPFLSNARYALKDLYTIARHIDLDFAKKLNELTNFLVESRK